MHKAKLAVFGALVWNVVPAQAQVQPFPVSPPPSPPPAPPPTPNQPRSVTPLNNPGSWVTVDDYPAKALREERDGTTEFRLTISPEGLVIGCDITVSSGSADLDDVSCRLVSTRARFRPAVDSFGKPAVGTYSTRVKWVIPEEKQTAMGPILLENHPMPGQSIIAFTIDTDGRAKECRLVSGPDPADFMLWAMPCDYNQVFPVYRDARGNPVPKRVRLAITITLPSATMPPSRKKKRR